MSKRIEIQVEIFLLFCIFLHTVAAGAENQSSVPREKKMSNNKHA